MINTAQIRAARGLLKWTQATLAHRAAVSTVTLNMIENETVRPRESTLASIKAALEGGGVQFLDEDGFGVGVKFNRADAQNGAGQRRPGALPLDPAGA